MAALSPLESPTLKVPITPLLQRVRAEYLEMPGLKLTAPQARRLWGLDCATCDAASTKPLTMPTGDRGRLDKHESVPPSGPQPSQANPE